MTTGPKDVPEPGGHPDLGLIAAHAERRLDGAEAARMDGHIASCPTCYEVFAETVRFVLDEEVEEAEEPPRRRGTATIPFGRRLLLGRPFRAAAALAAAASLLLALSYFRGRAGRPSPPLLAELAEAVGTRRFVEPRLSGGFRHGRLAVLRSDQAPPEGLDAYPGAVLSAVARIRERAEADPSPEALGALGVTYLVSGDFDAAVKALESATAQAPDDPGLRSDLAAAYLARASRLDDPSDLPKALDAAERAIALDSPPEEAWFNRALALEKLHLVDAARKAWQDYLERDAASGWADEARRHLEDLPADKQSSLEEERSRVRAALQEGEGAVARLAREEPVAVRDAFQQVLLPAWAEAYATGQPNAGSLRDQATLVGDALLASTGDALARDTARALHEPEAGASQDPLREQALGVLAFREAQRLYDAQQPSCPRFREARRLLEAGGSPYALRARERAVWACLYPAESRAGLAELDRLEAAARERSFQDLLGRVHRLQGFFLWHRGDLISALDRQGLALAVFSGVRDTEFTSLAFLGLAETLNTLGESRRAWAARVKALIGLGAFRDPRWRHSTLEEAALACVDEHLPRAALALQAVVVEAARRWSNALAVSDALLRRATMLQALGALEPAAADVAEARRWIAQIGDEAVRKRFQAEADAVEGEGLADAEPERAAERLGKALAYFDVSSPVRAPRLRHLLARAHVRRGQQAEAERELLAAIERLESQRASLAVATLQASFFDQAASVFDEMVDLQVNGLHDPERALAFVERGRARQIADALAGPRADAAAEASARTLPRPHEPAELRRALPEGVALVYHASRDDRLLSWVLTREASRFVERPTTASEMSRLVAAHVAALEERAALSVVRARAARLHDELVRPLAPFLRSSRALVFVGDHTLHRVAFASLWDRESGRYLVEDRLVGLAPSGTVFVRATAASARRREDPAPAALVVGNPRLDPEMGLPSLPEAEREALDVAQLYARSARLTGSAATKAAFLERLPESRVVHFAGHGASGDVPWSARLLFAPDPPDGGALFLHELDGKTLPRTRLVVLAACHTAAGAPSPVEGALSLARPFLAAGVPSVVGSLWAVDDAVSRRFSVAFHRALLDGGEPLVALQRTQLALLRDGDAVLSHPASWAGFVAVGGLDPRALAARPGPTGL